MNNTANMKKGTDGQTWRTLTWFETIFILWFLKTRWPNSFSKFISTEVLNMWKSYMSTAEWRINYMKDDNHPSSNSSLRSSHIWFSYIQNFIIILSRVHNEPIQRLAPSWLVSLIGRALHWYRRGQRGWIPGCKENHFFYSGKLNS